MLCHGRRELNIVLMAKWLWNVVQFFNKWIPIAEPLGHGPWLSRALRELKEM
jgi:hypothetical protein